MAIRRITISVPKEVAGRIKKAAGETPVSAWVTRLVEEHLDDAELDRKWREYCDDVGVKGADVRRADALFKRLTRRSGRRGAA